MYIKQIFISLTSVYSVSEEVECKQNGDFFWSYDSPKNENLLGEVSLPTKQAEY